MKNSNRRSSHGHYGSKRRELVRQAHSRGSHALTHKTDINTVTTTLYAASLAITEFGFEFYFEGRPYLREGEQTGVNV